MFFMIVKDRFSFDTNILVYAVDRDAGERHGRSKVLLEKAARRDCVLTIQALAEFFHATTRKNLLEPGFRARLARRVSDRICRRRCSRRSN